jgi:hypothetical protein
MTVAKSESRVLKTIYTLKSGKSIVVSMLEDECIRVYNEWINYTTDNDSTIISPKIVIEKKENNKIVEICAILVSEISAIQIDDVKRFNRREV